MTDYDPPASCASDACDCGGACDDEFDRFDLSSLTAEQARHALALLQYTDPYGGDGVLVLGDLELPFTVAEVPALRAVLEGIARPR